MPTTFYFKTTAGGKPYFRSTGEWHSLPSDVVVKIDWHPTTDDIVFACGSVTYTIQSGDVVNINGSILSGSIEDRYKTLIDLFRKANTGNGGSGSSDFTSGEVATLKQIIQSYTTP